MRAISILAVLCVIVLIFISLRNDKNTIYNGVVSHDCDLTYEHNEPFWNVFAPVDTSKDGNPDLEVKITGMAVSKFLFLRAAHPEKDIVLELIEVDDAKHGEVAHFCLGGAVYNTEN